MSTEFYHNKYNTAIIKHLWNLMTKKSQILIIKVYVLRLFCKANYFVGHSISMED